MLFPDIRKRLAAQFSLYVLIGLGNTALTAAIMAGMGILGFHYIFYTAVGYLAGFLNSYYWNSRLTFQTKRHSNRLVIGFFAANGALLLLVQILQVFLIEFIKCPEILAVLVGMAGYTVAGFFINRMLLSQPCRK